MLSPIAYKVIHLLGVLMVFLSLGGLCLHAMNGGTKESNTRHRLVAITYGVGLLLIPAAGFGWLGSSETMQGGMPGWVWAKIGIWLVIGGLLVLPYRKPHLGRTLWFVGPLLGALAALIAITKPF
jgi:hypothetical protein